MAGVARRGDHDERVARDHPPGAIEQPLLLEARKPGRIRGGEDVGPGALFELAGEELRARELELDAHTGTVHFGPLPEQLAALNRSHMAVHELVVEALIERDRGKAKYALMLDPLTAAVCSAAEIALFTPRN